MKVMVMATKVMITVRRSNDDDGDYDGGEVFLMIEQGEKLNLSFLDFKSRPLLWIKAINHTQIKYLEVINLIISPTPMNNIKTLLLP